MELIMYKLKSQYSNIVQIRIASFPMVFFVII